MFSGEYEGRRYELWHAARAYQWRAGEVGEANFQDKGASDAMGSFDHRKANERFVEAVIQAVDEAGIDPATVSLTRPTQREPAATEKELGVLRLRRSEVGRGYEQARENADTTLSDRARRDYLQDADRLAEEIDALDVAIEALTVDDAPGPTPPGPVEIGNLATVLSLILDSPDQALGPEVVYSIRQFVDNGRILDCWDDGALWGTFCFDLVLPSRYGVVRLPVSFEVGNRAKGVDRGANGRRHERIIEMLMTSEVTLDELVPRLDTADPHHLRWKLVKRLADHLGLERGPAAAALDCPLLHTRQAIWALGTGNDLPSAMPGLTDAQTRRFLEHLREAYWRGEWRPSAWMRGGEGRRREAVRFVADRSGDDPTVGARLQELMAAMAWKTVTSADSMLYDGRADGVPRPLERTMPWPQGHFEADPMTGKLRKGATVPIGEKRVRLRRCPWCERYLLTQPIDCPEGGADPLLCGGCRRTPTDPTLVYPAGYELMWEGPWGHTAVDRGERASKSARGDSLGTRLGPEPPMPSLTRASNACRRNKDKRKERPMGIGRASE